MISGKTPDSIPLNEFRFDDPRQLAVYDYLKRLVGEGAASFYKDACRHMATKPPFETSTHIVAHLLREIESALRDVLESITEPITSVGNEEENHKNEIKVILRALDISEDEPLANAWLSLPGKNGLQRMTHRNNLEAARPVDTAFQELWTNVNSILFLVLEKFETRYIKVFEAIDEISAKANPSKADAQKLKLHIPNNRVAHDHFFEKISSPKWIPLLEQEGFFKNPPTVERGIDGAERHPTWPVFTYLLKIANTESEAVTKILYQIPDTENGNVKSGAIEIAIKLPREKKLELIPRVTKWMNADSQFFNAMKSIEFIQSLNDDKEIDVALSISMELLEFVSEDTPSIPETGYIPSREPKTRIDRWHYVRFLHDTFIPIAKKNSSKSLPLIISLLDKHCSFSHPHRKGESFEDYSFIARPAIEITEHMHRDDIEDSLIEAIFDVAVSTIETDNKFLSFVVDELRKYPWPVFKRIILYLLSKYPTLETVRVVEYVSDTTLIHDSNYNHEYALLADKGFQYLNTAQKKAVYDFIDTAEPAKEIVKKLNYEKEEAERYIKMWQRDSFASFGSCLDAEQKAKYEALVQELGKADDPKVPPERNRIFVGPVSDVDAEKIGKMSPDELVELFTNWQPKKEPHGFGPSKEGLGRELGIAIKKDPLRFSSFAMRMAGLDATFVRNYLQPFSEIVQNHAKFEWLSIVDLCLWVAEQPRDIPNRQGGDPFDEDPDWGWTRRAAISLISHGMNSNVIPVDQYEKVWKIIKILTDDPNPTPEQELTREGSLSEDAYGLTINSVRGEAMTAVIEYGLWMSRLVEMLPEENRPKIDGFVSFSGMEEILEKHLVSDPSIAVRAAYGRYLPWIISLDKKWAFAHMKDIFPDGAFGTPLYDAAWETYLGHVPAYDDVFEALGKQYVEAVNNIGIEKTKKSRLNRDARLAEHLMTFFWRGKLNMNDKDGLFVKFWKNADEDTKLHAIDFLGRSLQVLKDPLSEEQEKLLKDLWETRISEAESAVDKKPYEKEMGAFGWWFASAKLDEGWSIAQFLRVLNIAKKVNADYYVVDRLVVLADTKPFEAVNILSKIAHRDRQQWVLFGNEDDLKDILNKALRSSDITAQTAARELVSRLVSWGYTTYSDVLLLPPPISDN